MTVSEFRAAYRRGPYAWPGGYPVYAICNDGKLLCWQCLKAERRLILEACREPEYRTGWELAGFDILWEGLESCGNCGRTLGSAYQDAPVYFPPQGHE